MACPDHWILFSDVMNVLFMWPPEKEIGHKSMEVKQKHVEERGYRRQMLAEITVFSFL